MKLLPKLTTAISIVIFSAIFLKCTKQNSPSNKDYNLRDPTTSLSNPSFSPLSQDFSTTIKSKFQGIETPINSVNLTTIQNVIQATVTDIKAISWNDGIDLATEFNNDQDMILVFGLFHAAREKYIASGGVIPADPAFTSDMSCFLTAVSTVIGITQAKSIWNSIVQTGATPRTIIQALKLVAKRISGIITIGIMVYEVGACLGWWSFSIPERRDDALYLGVPVGPHIPNEFFDSNYFNSVKNDIINFIVFTGRASNDLLAGNMVNKVHLSGGAYTLTMTLAVPAVNSYFRYKNGPI